MRTPALALTLLLAAEAHAAAPPIDFPRALTEAEPAQAMRAELKQATDVHQRLLDCMQRKIRDLEEQAKREPDQRKRDLMERLRAERVAALKQAFAAMRATLKKAEAARIAALMTCAERHARTQASETDAVIRAMNADRCEPELAGRAPVSQPSAAQLAEICQ